MSLGKALEGKELPDEIKRRLILVSVPYVSFDERERRGELVVDAAVAEEVGEIFQKLFEMRFPIHKIVPVSGYKWDDDASMAANNTSAFNYRLIFGTERLSNHSYGRAIDINPLQNPYTRLDGATVPLGARYDLVQKGTITADVAAVFKSYGWRWGGEWQPDKDWQHFEKP